MRSWLQGCVQISRSMPHIQLQHREDKWVLNFLNNLLSDYTLDRHLTKEPWMCCKSCKLFGHSNKIRVKLGAVFFFYVNTLSQRDGPSGLYLSRTKAVTLILQYVTQSKSSILSVSFVCMGVFCPWSLQFISLLALDLCLESAKINKAN